MEEIQFVYVTDTMEWSLNHRASHRMDCILQPVGQWNYNCKIGLQESAWALFNLQRHLVPNKENPCTHFPSCRHAHLYLFKVWIKILKINLKATFYLKI